MPCADPPGDSPGEAASGPIEYAPVCSPSDDYVGTPQAAPRTAFYDLLGALSPRAAAYGQRGFCNGLTPVKPTTRMCQPQRHIIVFSRA